MGNFTLIEFHRRRDFSKKINATFEFIRQNWKPLFKSIFMIAGPPVIVAGMIIGSFFGDLLSLTQGMANLGANPQVTQDYFMSASFWLQIVLAFTFVLLSSVMSIATINNYIILYGERQSNRIDVSEVWQRVSATFWMYFRTTLFFGILIIVVYALMVIPVTMLAAISPGLIILGVMMLFFAIIYMMISVSLTFIIRAIEKKRFFDSLARSFKLVHGKWWSTFGLILILYFVMMTISYIPLIPWYGTMIVTSLHDTSEVGGSESQSFSGILMVVFFTLYYMIQLILSALPNIGIAFQYFNLVELKEAKGLLSQIDTFGQPSTPAPPDERY
ncbi:MAG: hypothetical protein WKF87_01995 [Chryseolinea sp.]